MPFPRGTTTSVPDPAEAKALLERLRSADGPSRRLDDDIHDLLQVSVPLAIAYTASLDDALDLAEIAIPGWSVDIQCNRLPHPRDLEDHKGAPPFLYASTSAPADAGRHTPTFHPAIPPEAGATRALSVCCAILASLVSRYARHGRPHTEAA